MIRKQNPQYLKSKIEYFHALSYNYKKVRILKMYSKRKMYKKLIRIKQF